MDSASNAKVILNTTVDARGYVHVALHVPSTPIVWLHANEDKVEIEMIHQRRISTNTKFALPKRQQIAQWKKERKDRQAQRRLRRTQKYCDLMMAESQGLFDFTLNHRVDVSDTIKETAEEFKNQLLSTFSEISGQTNATVTDIKDSLSSVMQQVGSHVQNFMDAVKNIFWLIPIIACVCFVATKPSKTALAAALFGVLSMFLPSCLNPLTEMVSSFITKHEIESQMGSMDIKTIMKIVSYGTFLLTMGGCDKALKLFDAFQNVTMRESSINGKRSTFIAETISTIQDTINHVLSLFGKDKISVFKSGVDEVDAWCAQVSEVTKNFSLCESDISIDVVESLSDLRRQAVDLENLYRMDKVCGPVLSKYVNQMDMICRANASALSSFKNIRPEPVCLSLTGKPGTGKSMLCDILTHAVMAKAMPVEKIIANKGDFKGEIFAQGSSEYWNGYCGQYTHVMDDFMQQVNAVGATDSDAMNLVRIVNSWMYPLNFADLENKGKNNFRSKFVMLTTNVANMNEPLRRVITDPGAVFRRMHFPYQLGVRREFRRPGCGEFDANALDVQKFMAYKSQYNEIPTQAWFFAKFDFENGKRVDNTRRISFDELVDEISRTLIARNESFLNREGPIVNMVNKILQERGIESQAGEQIPVISTGRLIECTTCHHLPLVYSNATKTLQQSMEYLKDNITSVRETLVSSLWNPIAFAKNNPVIATLLAIGSLSIFFMIARFALSSLCKYLFGEEDPKVDLEGQLIDYKTLKDLGEKKDMPCDVQNNVSKNLFEFTIVDEYRGWHINCGTCVALAGRTFMLPNHFITEMENLEGASSTTKVHLRNVFNNEFDTEIAFSEVMRFQKIRKPDEDIAFMRMPISLACQDIVDKFIDETDLHKLKSCDVMLACARVIPHQVVRDRCFGIGERFDRYMVDGGKRTVKRGYKYNIPTAKGDCGGLLMLGPKTVLTGGRKITGMHSAGSPKLGLGFSTIVTRQQVCEALNRFHEIRDCDLPHEITGECNDFPVKGSFMPLYTVSKPSVMPPYTKLCKTPLYEAWSENTRFPAHLRSFKDENGDEIVPMINALSKYNGPVRVYPEQDIEDVAWVAWKCVTDATAHITDRKIFSFEEAAAGDESNPLFRSVPRRTSAGYPFTVHGASGKKDFFGYAEEFDFDSDNCKWLRTYVESIISSAKEGKRQFHVFNDFLKDERRSEKKNKTGQTRLVSGAPIAYVLAFRMYFGRFCSALMEARIESGCCAGVNVYQEWGYLRDHLLNKSEKVIAGDYSAFDSSEQPQIHNAILKYINEWYNDGAENARIREVLWLDLTNSRHIGGDGKNNNLIYQWNHSLPSGHPATTAVNSMYNLFLFAYCWKDIMGLENLGDYNKHVRVVVLGDDNVVAISPSVVEKYNQHSVTEAMTRLYMTYTTEAKDDEEVDSVRTIDQVTFLKREFRDENGHCFGPLAMETILQMPYWCRDKNNVTEIMQSNFETAMMELSAHPQETWDEWAPVMLKEFNSLGYKTAGPPSRTYYQARFKAAKCDY
ncbi:hypothetical protein 1 [Beihai picorna-like virus 79]|uniref:hypothetical protein 1 n=1 Tax=Beihai picorna-like virus 79 TaxID=1922626 RepID=UPI00090A605D|nr:hypothetical protein 1 [Beihai picorna-like virus 79]APG76739.1 hypothetical protein 1 [Beihai picorna-like virus 79]